MPAAPVEKLCDDIRHNRFGGAAEMVDAAVKAFADAARTSPASSVTSFAEEIEADVDAVLGVMPSIAPMINLLHRVMSSVERVSQGGMALETAREEVARTVEQYRQRQTNALALIGSKGAQLIHDGDRVATYSTSGTVMSIFKSARKQGKQFEVVVTESRPANEGLRTMRETAELGVPVTLGIDAVLGPLMRGCSMLVVGADVITSMGEVLVKVGTYLAALVAHEYGMPFYVAADTSKFDPMTLDGFPIKIRDKGPRMVTADPVPPGARVINPTFELIPARLVTGIITEDGIVHPGNVATMMRTADLSQRLVAKLQAWVRIPTPA